MNTVADLHDADGEHRVRLTQAEALTNLRTVLGLSAAGEVKCSGTTGRPSAATVPLAWNLARAMDLDDATVWAELVKVYETIDPPGVVPILQRLALHDLV